MESASRGESERAREREQESEREDASVCAHASITSWPRERWGGVAPVTHDAIHHPRSDGQAPRIPAAARHAPRLGPPARGAAGRAQHALYVGGVAPQLLWLDVAAPHMRPSPALGDLEADGASAAHRVQDQLTSAAAAAAPPQGMRCGRQVPILGQKYAGRPGELLLILDGRSWVSVAINS
jgi:hypothetical protein